MRSTLQALAFGVALGASALALVPLLAACGGSTGPGLTPCADYSAVAAVTVDGTYRYGGGSIGPYSLRGTIVFQQVGNQVSVLDTTYDNANDRALEGTATLDGNRLDITLVPTNGDPDYTAQVVFHFADGGASFCCSFSDTNADVGPMGSYRGALQP
jgi:hypothetical protein